jgi:hypothetical protein
MNWDKDPAALADNEAIFLGNADIRYNKMVKLPGEETRTWSRALPVGVSWKGSLQIKMTKPSEQTVDYIHGTDSSTGRHRIFMFPYPEGGTFKTDKWLELTEQVSGTSDVGTSNLQLVDSALSSYADGYFDNWFYYNINNSAQGPIDSFVSATFTASLRRQVSGSSGNAYTLSRCDCNFNNLVPIRLVKGDNESVIVLSGGQDEYDGSTTINPVSDAKIQYIDRDYFNADYSFDGMLMARNNLDGANHESGTKPIVTNVDKVTNMTEDPWPEGRYMFLASPIYDGYQEGPIHEGQGKDPYQMYNLLYNSTLNIASGEATHGFEIDLLIYANRTGAETKRMKNREAWDYRITGIAIYCAELVATGVTNENTLASPFRRVTTIDINDADWTAGSPGLYSIDDIRITYQQFANGDTQADIQGHSSYRTTMNAAFSVSVAQTRFYGYIFPDEERPDFIVKTAVSSDGFNTPDVKPWTLTVDFSNYGITKILGMFESINHLIVVGDDRIVRYNPVTGKVARILVERGGIAVNGMVEVNGRIYICAQDDIYVFSTIGSFEQEGERMISLTDRNGKGGIKSLYQGTTNKQNASLGYDRIRNCLLLQTGFLFQYAFFLDVGAWVFYSTGGSNTYLRMITDEDGLISATGTGGFFTPFSPNADKSVQMQWQSKRMIGPGRTKRIRIHSNKVENVTYRLQDAESSDIKIRGTYYTFDKNRTGKEASDDFDALEIVIQTPNSTVDTHEIDRVEVTFDETEVR